MNHRRVGSRRAAVLALVAGVLALSVPAGTRGDPGEGSFVPAGDGPVAVADSAAAAERYVFDPVHTYIGFSARHMLVTRVRGKFRSFDGEIQYDPERPTRSSVRVTIDVSSLNTDNDRRDSHLRSSDFFDAERYPTISFESTSVERDGDGYVLVGDLTIKETTMRVRIPFVLRGPVDAGRGTKRIGAEAEITVNRFDWGLSWDGAMSAGDLIVSEEAVLELNVEAVNGADG